MRKSLLVLMMLFLSACSSLKDINWNPFSSAEEKVENEHFSENVNPYLWKAAYDKLSFLGFSKIDHEHGWLETNWSIPEKNERFKIQVWINSAALRADSMQVVVLKQQFDDGAWQKRTASYALSQEIEKEILLVARDIYRNNIVR